MENSVCELANLQSRVKLVNVDFGKREFCILHQALPPQSESFFLNLKSMESPPPASQKEDPAPASERGGWTSEENNVVLDYLLTIVTLGKKIEKPNAVAFYKKAAGHLKLNNCNQNELKNQVGNFITCSSMCVPKAHMLKPQLNLSPGEESSQEVRRNGQTEQGVLKGRLLLEVLKQIVLLIKCSQTKM